MGAFRMCKGPKTCESLRPYKATVTLGPFASDHAPREQNASKPTPSSPHEQVYMDGGRDRSEDKFMADLEQFSVEEGGV